MGVYLYYPIWPPSSLKRRASSFTTTSSKAPVSRASPGSSTRLILAPPRRSPPSSRTALPPSLCLRPRAISGCPVLCGSPPSEPVSLVCWRRSGPRPGPALRRHVSCCWQPFTASVNRGRRPRWPTGTPEPSCIRSGESPRSVSPRRPSGMLLKRSCPSIWIRWPPAMTTRWIAPNCVCWICGKASRW